MAFRQIITDTIGFSLNIDFFLFETAVWYTVPIFSFYATCILHLAVEYIDIIDIVQVTELKKKLIN